MEYVRKTFTFEGKRYTVRGHTEKEAIMKMANKIRDLEEGRVVISGSMTVEDWGLKALAVYRPNQSETTRVSDKIKMKSGIFQYIGNRPIKSIKKIDLQEVLNKQKGKSRAHIKKIRQLIQFIFSTAAAEKLIAEDPSRNLIEPSGYKGERRQITPEERKHYMLVHNDDERFVMFDIMLFCGLRPEEVRNLKGKDIQTTKRGKRLYHILHVPGTKTDNAERFVPIPDELYEKIKDTPKAQYICLNKLGEKHTANSYRSVLKALRRAMNISMGCKVERNALVPPYPLAKDFVPYDFRHTYCCDLQKAKVDIRTAQQLMGHSDITLTANIYTHADNETLVEAAKQIKDYSKKKVVKKHVKRKRVTHPVTQSAVTVGNT